MDKDWFATLLEDNGPPEQAMRPRPEQLAELEGVLVLIGWAYAASLVPSCTTSRPC